MSLEAHPKDYLRGSIFLNRYCPWGIMKGMGTYDTAVRAAGQSATIANFSVYLLVLLSNRDC